MKKKKKEKANRDQRGEAAAVHTAPAQLCLTHVSVGPAPAGRAEAGPGFRLRSVGSGLLL